MSDPTVYAIASGKGGVGKTTLSINLGAAFAARDRTTVVVDADLGMANLATFLDLGIDADGSDPTLHDVLSGAVRIQEATYEVPGGFAVVPGGTTLDRFAEAETAALGDAIDDLRAAFDVVIMDIGAGLSHDTVLPLGLADAVLLVATPDLAAVENAAKTKALADRLERPIAGLALTRTGSQFDLDVEAVEDELGVPVLALVPEDPAVRESVRAGAPVVVTSPDAPAARGFTGLAAVLDGDDEVSIPVRPGGGEVAEVAVGTRGGSGVDGSDPDAAAASDRVDGGDAGAGDASGSESDEGDRSGSDDGGGGMSVEAARSSTEDDEPRGLLERLLSRF